MGINPDYFLGQRMQLQVGSAEEAIRKKIAEPLGLSLEEAAYGITRLVDTNMINAIRRVTIERGHDPRDFSLLCYGGGGGLFAGALAQELKIPRAIIPLGPAVFSAWGILNSDFREDVARTSVLPMTRLSVEELLQMFEDLAQLALERFRQSLAAGEEQTRAAHGIEAPRQVEDLREDVGLKDCSLVG